MISHKWHGILNHCHLQIFRLTPHKHQWQSPAQLTLYESNPPVTGGFPHKGSVMCQLFPCGDVMMFVKITSIANTVHHSRDTLQWHHNERDGVSNQQSQDCLLKGLFRHRSKKTSKFHITGLCAGNSPVSGEFPAQKASNAENVSIWWCHHDEEWQDYCSPYNRQNIGNGMQTETEWDKYKGPDYWVALKGHKISSTASALVSPAGKMTMPYNSKANFLPNMHIWR